MEKQDLESVAMLAKLEIPSDRFDEILNDMQNIVDFANKISLIKNLSSEGFSGFDNLENNFRSDEVIESNSQAEILKNCKTPEEGFFRLDLNEGLGG